MRRSGLQIGSAARCSQRHHEAAGAHAHPGGGDHAGQQDRRSGAERLKIQFAAYGFLYSVMNTALCKARPMDGLLSDGGDLEVGPGNHHHRDDHPGNQPCQPGTDLEARVAEGRWTANAGLRPASRRAERQASRSAT